MPATSWIKATLNPINQLLWRFGMRLSRNQGLIVVPGEFRARYERNLAELRKTPRDFSVSRDLHYDIGVHPDEYIDFECAFAARQIGTRHPQAILEVGSYRHFVLGLLAHFQVTTIDVRSRRPIVENEIVITCDAKKIDLPDASFDAVVSLCALEHFGLGRYGDEFDLEADHKAFREMIRVLKPEGALIFTTTITRARPSVSFNAHRIYSYEMIRAFCAGLTCLEEKFYSHTLRAFCPMEQVTAQMGAWDVYCGCWEKTEGS